MGMRHRSWGETSDASARKVADVRGPAPPTRAIAFMTGRSGHDSGVDPGHAGCAVGAPRRAPGTADGHRGPPRRRRLRACRDGRGLGRGGQRGASRVLHERRRGFGRPSARTRSTLPGCVRRSSEPRPSIIGYEAVDLPASTGRRAGQRPGAARAAGAPATHLPARCGADDGSHRDHPRPTASSSTPTTGRRASPRSTPSTRPPATRWRSRS